MKTNNFAKIMEMDNVVRKNMNTCPGLQYVFSYKQVVSSIEMHTIFVNTILQKISTSKKHILPFFGFNLKTRGIWHDNSIDFAVL
jgi:hypothetical protein